MTLDECYRMTLGEFDKVDDILASEMYTVSAEAQKVEDEVSFEDGAFLRGVAEGLMQARILLRRTVT